MSPPLRVRYLLHRVRYGVLVIRREDDLKLFSTVRCMHLEREDAESLVTAHLEVCKSGAREIRDDCPPHLWLRKLFFRDCWLSVCLTN